ncbi:hypothetical protein FHW92_002472 [Novosphingobium sp. SG707]|nr:hypothetical protein [Novosphingobium sp. SG707]
MRLLHVYHGETASLPIVELNGEGSFITAVRPHAAACVI